jgi:hypothetical protein
MDTHNTIRSGLDLYLRLLHHADSEIRAATAQVIGWLPDCSKQSLDPLWGTLVKESAPKALFMQLESIALLFRFARPLPISDRDALMRFIDNLSRSHSDHEIRLRAAMTWVQINLGIKISERKTVPSNMIALLGDALIDHKKYHDLWYHSYDEPVSVYVRMAGMNVMARMLELKDLTPYPAHLIAGKMLDETFDRRGVYGHKAVYSAYKNRHNDKPDDHYQLPEHHKQYTGGKLRHRDQREVIEAIVACEPFWEYPTNLLSFFYGLPDEREQLRALLAEG